MSFGSKLGVWIDDHFQRGRAGLGRSMAVKLGFDRHNKLYKWPYKQGL